LLDCTALDKLGCRQQFGQSPAEPAEAVPLLDIASLVLYGCQALPVRLKILLDRLFSVLRPEQVLQVLRGFGWTQEDYARGYILQVRTREDKFGCSHKSPCLSHPSSDLWAVR